MHEESKIAEAQYFLQELIRSAPRDPEVTRYDVSAFLSAARSALQYALEEAKGKPGGQSWYDAAVKVDPVVQFLKDSRDINIHDRPVPMRTHTTIGVGQGALTLSSTSPTVLIKAGDQVIEWVPPPPRIPPLPATMEPQPTSHTYQFKDWSGPEAVIALCTRYLGEVRRIVDEGRALGFLTP
jgi:hypothetical protein